jgi:hypothetical protein
MDENIRTENESEIERRSYHFIEVRAGEPGEEPRIEGIAAVYDQPTEIETYSGSFVEVIEPGFFEDAMDNDVRALWNHNTDIVLGRTKSGTLRLVDKQEGLGVEIDPPDTQAGRDAVTSIRRGDVDQMSFAFSVRTGGDDWKEKDGKMVRTLKRGACKQLYDVSPVTFPAYPQTSVAVRSALMDHQLAAEASRDGDAGQEPQAEAEQAKAQARRRRRSRVRKLDLTLKMED